MLWCSLLQVYVADLWFNPGWQVSTAHPLAHPPLVRQGENQKGKRKKCMDRDKNSLIIKEK